MNNNNAMAWGKAAKKAYDQSKLVESMAPLSSRANPWAAFALGFCFGAIGIAIYFRSWKDFFVCVGLFILLALAMPMGPGEIVGWLFAAFYGAWRAHSSNQKRLAPN